MTAAPHKTPQILKSDIQITNWELDGQEKTKKGEAFNVTVLCSALVLNLEPTPFLEQINFLELEKKDQKGPWLNWQHATENNSTLCPELNPW